MGRKKGEEKGTNEPARFNTQILVRDDIQEHVRKLHPLCELLSGGLSAERSTTEPVLSLVRTYLHASAGPELFSLYSLAKQGHQLSQDLAGENKKAVGGESAACLHQLYADRWAEMPADIKGRIQKDFETKMRAGSIILRLVARFGTGILLTCKINLRRL